MSGVSGAQEYGADIERLRVLYDSLKNENGSFNASIRYAKTISSRLGASNPDLAKAWMDVGDKLNYFSVEMTNKIGSLYHFISSQMIGIEKTEQEQVQKVESFIQEGDRLIQELEGKKDL